MIELMLTVSFVLLGSILIQGSFFRASDMFGRYTHTLQATMRLDKEAAQVKELLYSGGAGNESGTWDLAGKSCDWSRDVKPVGGPNLYSVAYRATWTESGKPFEIKSGQYAYKKDILQNA